MIFVKIDSFKSDIINYYMTCIYINIIVHQPFFIDVILLLFTVYVLACYVCLASVHALSFSPLDAMRFHDAYHSTMQ